MDVLVERVAGLDVHRDTIVSCIRVPRPTGRGRASETREFASTAKGLERLGEWLAECGVTLVAMEATGVYWKPLFGAFEGVYELVLANAAHMKNVPGRKTDVGDAAWIAQLAEHGLLRSSFVPPRDIRQLRSMTRHRAGLMNERTRVIQRLEKALQDAGIKLTSVASTVLTKSGRSMLEALAAGERDPNTLAEMARGRLRSKIPALKEAMVGEFDHHHATLVREGLAHVDFLDGAVERVSHAITVLTAPHAAAIALLQTIPGVGPRLAEVILAEIGDDMSRFPTAGHLASWAGMCPGNNESAGRRGYGKTRPGSRWLRQALVEAAQASARTDSTYLAVRHARIRTRRGSLRAAIATGHAILVASWHILRDGVPFKELGVDFYSRRSPEVETRRLVRRLEALGHNVTIAPAA